MRRATALLAVLLLFGATACGERDEPTGPGLELYPVTVASAGDRPLVVHSPARRIAVLSPGPHEILRSLGAGRRIAGMPVDSGGVIRIEELRRLKPDLIVTSPSVDEMQLSRAAAAADVPVHVAPGESIREVKRAITQLGLITNQPAGARRLVRDIEAKRRLVQREVEVRQLPPVTVFVDVGFFTTVSDHSLIGDLIREARGRNVAGPRPDPGPVDLRELERLDPDVYIATSDSGTTLAVLKRNPRTRRLRAVREGRFVIVDTALLEPGPRIGEGLLEIARVLHPDAFR